MAQMPTKLIEDRQRDISTDTSFLAVPAESKTAFIRPTTPTDLHLPPPRQCLHQSLLVDAKSMMNTSCLRTLNEGSDRIVWNIFFTVSEPVDRLTG